MVAACQVGQCQLVTSCFISLACYRVRTKVASKLHCEARVRSCSAPLSYMYRSNLVAAGGGSGLLVHDLPEDGSKCHAKPVVETPSARVVNFYCRYNCTCP